MENLSVFILIERNSSAVWLYNIDIWLPRIGRLCFFCFALISLLLYFSDLASCISENFSLYWTSLWCLMIVSEKRIRQGTSFQYQKSHLDLGFWYCICPTQSIFTNTETAMLSTAAGWEGRRCGGGRVLVCLWSGNAPCLVVLPSLQIIFLRHHIHREIQAARLNIAGETRITRSFQQLMVEGRRPATRLWFKLSLVKDLNWLVIAYILLV